MTDRTIVSPPPPAPTSAPTPSSDPISPVTRTGTFPHKTSPAVATQTPLIDTSTPAINAAPVELDGIPAYPPEDGKRRAVREGSAGVISPGDEEDIDGEFLGEGRSVGRGVREVCFIFPSIHIFMVHFFWKLEVGVSRLMCVVLL